MGLVSLLYTILSTLVWLLPFLLMVGWIVGMADPSGRWPVTRILNAIAAPYLRLVSGMLPRIGALDISPLLIWLMSILVGILLRRSFYGF